MHDVVTYCEADTASTYNLFVVVHNAKIQEKIDYLYTKIDSCEDLILRGMYARRVLRLKSELICMKDMVRGE